MLPNKEFNLSRKSWFSIVISVLLFGSIILTQFAAVKSRDDRSQAATCGGGQTKITLRPNGDQLLGRWAQVPSDGRGYFEKVDETGNGDSDSSYIWDDTALAGGSVVAFAHSSGGLSASVHKIDSVTIVSRVRQTQGSQTGPYIEMGLVINSNQYFSPGTKYHPLSNLSYSTTTEYTWNTDPSTGGQWSVSSINSALIAARSTRPSQPNSIVMTQIYMEVCYSFLPPGPDIKANNSNGPITIGYNTPATISWSSSNTTSCSVSWSGGSWSGTSGSQPSGNLTSNRTYTLSCTGAGGSASDSVIVNVSAAPPPPPPPPPPAKPPSTKPSSPSTPPPATTTPPAQSAGDPSDIALSFTENSFLSGIMEVNLEVEGTTLKQKVSVEKSTLGLQLKTNSQLKKNQTYTLKTFSRSSFVQKINFSYIDFTTVKIGSYTMGDFNGDARIDQTDLNSMVPKGMSEQKDIYDINFDKVINSVDYSLFLVNLGKVNQ